MTITSGSSKLASDFNSAYGPTNSGSPYASSAAATNMVAALYGVGYGDRGYGQVSPTINKKTVGNPNEPLWVCMPSGDNNGDGGWNTTHFSVDNTKKYRSSVWFRMNFAQSGAGRFYHGLSGAGNTYNSGNVVDGNPYFHYPASDDLIQGQWYLSVGIIHEAGYNGADTGLTGIYDVHGNKVWGGSDFRMAPGATIQQQRVYHYYDNTTTQRQWLARPRWEMITGSEPSITTLLNAPWETVSADTLLKPSQWTLTNPLGGDIGMFQLNQSAINENGIVQANLGTNMTGPTGSMVKGQDFADIRTALANMASYQGTSQATLPAASVFAAGQPVNGANEQALATFAATIDANRLLANAANMSVTNLGTITRGTSWGSGNGYIQCQVGFNFPTEAAARFFFNSGGTLNIAMAHPNVSTPQDSDWNTILSAAGTVKIGARSSSRTGTIGTLNGALGYYTLTGAFGAILDGTNVGTGAYSANDFLIDAYVSGVGGVNGANGTSVVVRVTIWDSHTNAFSDLVQPGTNATFSVTKAAAVFPNIVTPSLATSFGF